MLTIPAGKPWHYYFSHLLIIAGLVIVGSIVFALLGTVICRFIYPDIDVEELLSNPSRMLSHPTASFIIVGMTSIGSFVAPAVVYPLVLRQSPIPFHTLSQRAPLVLVVLAVVLAVMTISPTVLTVKLNELVDVSQWGSVGKWLMQQETEAEELTSGLLGNRTAQGFILAIIVVAVIPAVGEELLFRGVLQRLLQSWIGKHGGIIIAAAIFSAIHLQFSGFLPRFFLGLVLGYVFFWTKNLWLPIIIHFVNNALAVIAAHSGGAGELDTEDIGPSEMIFVVVGTVLFAGFLYFFYRLAKAKRINGDQLDQDRHLEPTTSS